MVFPNPELQWAKVKANQEFFRVCHSSKEGFFLFLFLIHSFIFFFLYINRELVAMCILLALVIVSPLP